MKTTKKRQNLFIVTFIIVLFTVGIFCGEANSFIKMQPPSEGLWVITGQELIDYDVILNGSVSIESGGELTISNANVLFDSNSTHSLIFDVDGTLIIDNSNISVTNLNYNFTISGNGDSEVSIIDSRLDNARVYLLNCDFIAERSIFNNFMLFSANLLSEFIVIDSTFQNSQVGIDLLDCDSATLSGNEFIFVNYGIDIVTADNATFTENTFRNITTEGIHVTLVDVTYATNNDFINATTGIRVDDKKIELIGNRFEQNEIAVVLDNAAYSLIHQNNFTDIFDTGVHASVSREVEITDNRFVDSTSGIETISSLYPLIYDCFFDNVDNGIIILDSDATIIMNNEFVNIADLGVEITDSWDVEVLENTFNNATVAINLVSGRRSTIQGNTFYQVDEGIGVISSREIEILGNIIEETVTGIYIEQTQESIVTANGAIKATFGLSLWSVRDITLGSNGVFDSRYGFSIWFSEGVRLLGNEVNTSDIGIISRSTYQLEIRDGSLKALDIGIQLIGSPNPIISGNTFDDITNEAIVLKDSSGFHVYQNNFEDVGSYADIIDCLGYFNTTESGNYYKNEVGTDPVYIDTVGSIDIYDENPLGSPYVVKPTIEFVSRNIDYPTDIDDVIVETQIFVPTGVALSVYLEYIGNFENDWTSIDITASEDPVGQIGAINRYSGTIPAYPYDYTIIYRINVEYEDLGETISVITLNDTYTVGESDSTPIIIYNPVILTETVTEEDEITTITPAAYYRDIYYIIEVYILNKTVDIGRIAGNRHVNVTWTEINTQTNETETVTAVMYYNETADDNLYYFTFEKRYDAGMIIDFFISVVDINGTLYKTVENTTMIIQEPPEETGFDTVTLLSIGATLLIVQALVIIRRRRKRKEE